MIRYEVWFPYDANTSSEAKIVALRAEYGWQAIAWYFDILSRLRKHPQHLLEWSRPYAKSDLASSYGITVEHLTKVVNSMVNGLDLLFEKDGSLYSSGFNKNMVGMEENKKQKSDAGKASAEKRRIERESTNVRSTDVEHSFNVRSTSVQQRREEEIRKEGEGSAHVRVGTGAGANNAIVSQPATNGHQTQTLAIDPFSPEALKAAVRNGTVTTEQRYRLETRPEKREKNPDLTRKNPSPQANSNGQVPKNPIFNDDPFGTQD